MSLINDALKKAQRQRAEDTASPVGGGLAGRPNQPKSQSLVLIAAGALVLVAGSVAGTIFLLNRSAAPKPDAVTTTTPPPAATPAIAENKTSTPAPETAKTPKPLPVETKTAPAPTPTPALATTKAPSTPPPASAPATPPATTATPTATAVAPTPVAAPAQVPAAPAPVPEAVAKLQEQIHTYLENLRIVGVRAAGEDSRVRMNDRNYRLNEIVERTLQLRLIKVESNALTFSDATGATYVRYF